MSFNLTPPKQNLPSQCTQIHCQGGHIMPTRSRNPEKIEALLTQAAELRAAGQTWETVAAAVGRSAETVRRWPKQHPKLWLRLLA